MRTLNGTALLLWVNSATIVLSVGLCLGALIADGPEATLARSGGSTHLVATGLGWRQFTSGVSKMAFAYVGVLMYPEIILEMEEPRDFPKALYAGAPFQLAAFMTVGCVGSNPTPCPTPTLKLSPSPSPDPNPNPNPNQVGCVGYRYLGDAAHGLLINAVPPGWISRTCAASLFVHLLITYLIKVRPLGITPYMHMHMHMCMHMCM